MTGVQDPGGSLRVAERISCMMQEMGIPAVVIGAVALAAHRYIRFTEDIDLGAVAELEQMRELARRLHAEGLETQLHEPDHDDPLGGVLDVRGAFGLVQIVNFGGRFPAVIRDALAGLELRMHEGSPLRLAPIAQLVALKLYAGGVSSRSDIIGLLRHNPEVDIEEIRATCKKYGLKGFDAVLEELREP